MKSLVLKDFYNIKNNIKALIFMILAFVCIFMTQTGALSCIIALSVLCGTMIITTFSFDERSKWAMYAMTMPISKKEYVKGKFITMILFALISATGSLIISTVMGLLFKQISLEQEGVVLELLLMALVGFLIAEVMGSVSLPILFKLGAEKARMVTLISVAVPMGMGYGIYTLVSSLHLEITAQLVAIGMIVGLVLILIWNYIMYRVCIKIFEEKELSKI